MAVGSVFIMAVDRKWSPIDGCRLGRETTCGVLSICLFICMCVCMYDIKCV